MGCSHQICLSQGCSFSRLASSSRQRVKWLSDKWCHKHWNLSFAGPFQYKLPPVLVRLLFPVLLLPLQPGFVSLCRWCGSMREPLFSDWGTSFLAEPKDPVRCLLSSPQPCCSSSACLTKLTCWCPPSRRGQAGDLMDFVPFLLRASTFWCLFHHRNSLKVWAHVCCSFVVLHAEPSPALQNRRGNFCSSDDEPAVFLFLPQAFSFSFPVWTLITR